MLLQVLAGCQSWAYCLGLDIVGVPSPPAVPVYMDVEADICVGPNNVSRIFDMLHMVAFGYLLGVWYLKKSSPVGQPPLNWLHPGSDASLPRTTRFHEDYSLRRVVIVLMNLDQEEHMNLPCTPISGGLKSFIYSKGCRSSTNHEDTRQPDTLVIVSSISYDWYKVLDGRLTSFSLRLDTQNKHNG